PRAAPRQHSSSADRAGLAQPSHRVGKRRHRSAPERLAWRGRSPGPKLAQALHQVAEHARQPEGDSMFTPIDAEVPSSGGLSPYRSTLDAVRADLGVALDHQAATLAYVQPLTLLDVRRTGRAVFGATLLAAAA